MSESMGELIGRGTARVEEVSASDEFQATLVRLPDESLASWKARFDALFARIRDENKDIGISAYKLTVLFQDAYALDPEAIAAEAEAKAASERKLQHAHLEDWRRIVAESLPKRPAELAFSGHETPATMAVREWMASGTDRSLVLRGGVGAGKSTAAALYAKELLKPAMPKAGIDGPSLSLSYQRGKQQALVWVRPDQLVSAVLHDYDEKSPRLHRRGLVLDDVGRETKSDFVEALCTILDAGEHKLVITTNLTKTQMRERYDLRLLDRLNETCMAFDVPNKSMRNQDGNF